MAVINNAFPHAELYGTKVVGVTSTQKEPIARPSNLPLCFTWAERGRTAPMFGSGAKFTKNFGSETFNHGSSFFNHQIPFIETFLKNGNAIFLQRVLPPDAPPAASIALYVDILVQDVPDYQRDPDTGLYVTDANGAPIQLDSGGTPVVVPGITFIFIEEQCPQVNSNGDVLTAAYLASIAGDPDEATLSKPVANVLGNLTPKTGPRVDGATTSTMYPILEAEVDWQGKVGNNQGFRLYAATSQSSQPVNEALALDQNTALFRLQLVEKVAGSATPTVIETIKGTRYLEFSFRPNSKNTAFNTFIDINKTLKKAWTDTTDPLNPVYGNLGKFHVYQSNVESVCQTIATTENAIDSSVSADADDIYAINFIDGKHLNGAPYRTYVSAGTVSGGVNMTEYTAHYARGGGDGTLSMANFDAAVKYQLDNFGSLEYPLLDTAQYPITSVWDSGFSLPTKKSFFTPMSLTKRIIAMTCTQDLMEAQNTPDQDASILSALNAFASLSPDSIVYGTPVMRAACVMGCSELIDESWDGPFPYLLELAGQVSKYLSSGDGVWKEGLGWDTDPNNRVTMFKPSTNLWAPDLKRAKDWEAGGIWVQSFDMVDSFFPATQTFYPYDTAAPNSLITVFGIACLQIICEDVWKVLTGRNLDDASFIAKSNAEIISRVEGRFDGRFRITPNTYKSPVDVNNKFSWSCDVLMEAGPMETVGKFTVISQLLSDSNQ